jgi:cytochrome c oxidase subunit IV
MPEQMPDHASESQPPHAAEHPSMEHIVPASTYVLVFVGLLILTALTTGVAYINLGALHIGRASIDLNTVAALAIAVTKMLLVVLFFMHVKYSTGMTRIVVIAGIFWLGILISLTLADELTRGWTPQPQPWDTGLLLPFFLHLF